MPKRKRMTLSQPKRSKNKKHREMTQSHTVFVGGEPTAPDWKEWEDNSRMHSISHFQILGANDELSTFKLGDYAIILPEDKTVADKANMRIGHYWSAKIREIRVRKNNPQDEVWAKVQWLYDPSEASAAMERFKRGFPLGEYGRMERILSNHFDFVHSTCFEDHITVLEYDEKTERPKAIHADDHLFYRATFDVTKFVLETGLEKSCLCEVPYDPDAEHVAMHFCPNCLSSYHAACLQKPMEVSFAPRETRVAVPEAPPLDSNHLFNFKQQPTATARDPSVSLSDSDDSDEEHKINDYWDRYDLLPAELIALARSPMVKGRGTKLPKDWIVSGNLAVVSRAREIVDDVVRVGMNLPEKWEHVLAIPELNDGSPSNLLAWTMDDRGFRCPKCRYPI